MNKQSKKNLFPKTRELVRMALNDGMTQGDIARLCRTQQPTVSKWKSGSRLATRQQLKPLLQDYGDRLSRVPSKLYQTEAQPPQFIRVEGKLILRERFRGREPPKGPMAIRLSVHQQGKDRFVCVCEQTNAPFPVRNNAGFSGPVATDRQARWTVVGSLEGCKMTTEAVGVKSLQELRDWAFATAGKADYVTKYPGLANLAYLLTEALLNHGLVLEGLAELKIPQ